MERTLLIVDDIKSNREILKNILGKEYRLLEAKHGQEALELMEKRHRDISAILLDLGMPVMDGYAVLEYMRGSETLSQLPVIVTTGQTDAGAEERALKLGAMDYITKPYKATIIKQRIWNTINLRESAATVNALQRDRLTGLYSRDAFFERVQIMVRAHEPCHYIIACFDVQKFKIINDQYGTGKGDEVLKHIAETFKAGFAPNGGICCRIAADNFAVLYPAAFKDSEVLADMRREAGTIAGLASPLAFSIGRYCIDRTDLAPSAMYDRAVLAANSIKGRYDSVIANYSESMRQELIEEQEIVTEMDAALQERQFEVWFQPQYNHSTGSIIGAEALVRWRHPQKGLIPPAKFVPVFEKNGFVYAMDTYILEEVCRFLRSELDAEADPLPVSVNISRYDMFREGFVGRVTGFTDEYRIPKELLRLEVTESAFANSTERIVEVVKELVGLGFTIEIDDFGNGYSSLNTLKSVPAQVVKLDMGFFASDGKDDQRSGNIIESVVRMTKWLDMAVIAEGVETVEQADFLRSIGCSYVQGYLYAKPMPADEYERHFMGNPREEAQRPLTTTDNFDNDAFWNPQSMDSLIFNSFVGAACIYEYYNGRIELVRATDKYARMLGGDGMTVESLMGLDLMSYLDDTVSPATLEELAKNAADMGEVTGELLFVGLPGRPEKLYVRCVMRVVASADKRYLVYCLSSDISEQRAAEQREQTRTAQLHAIMDNLNCGITAVARKNGEWSFLLANDRFYELYGCQPEQREALSVSKLFKEICGEDAQRARETVERVMTSGAPDSMEYRVLCADGRQRWLRSFLSLTGCAMGCDKALLCTYTDITEEKNASRKLLDALPCGVGICVRNENDAHMSYLNKQFFSFFSVSDDSGVGCSVFENVNPEDHAALRVFFDKVLNSGESAHGIFRIKNGNSGEIPFRVSGVAMDSGEDGAIYVTFVPLSHESLSVKETLTVVLEKMMESSSELSFVKDDKLRYICCSRVFAKMVGLESEKDVVGKTDFDLFDRELAERYVADDRRLMKDGKSIVDLIESLPSEDGRAKYSSTSKYLLYDSEGKIMGLYGTGRDVTQTREAESRQEFLLNNIPGGVAMFEGTWKDLNSIQLVYFSDGYCRLFGYERDEYEKMSDANPTGLVVKEYVPGLVRQIEALVRTGAPIDYIYRACCKDGNYRWIHIKAVRGAQHGVNMTVNAVLFDITEHQEALQKLRVSEEENRLAIAHSGNVVCRYDIAKRTLSVSYNVNEIFDLAPVSENVPYDQVKQGLVSAETADMYISFYEKIISGEKTGSVVYQRKSKQGWRWLEEQFSTTFSIDGRPISAVLSFRDVTENFEKEAVYKKWRQSLSDKKPQTYCLLRCNLSKKAINTGSDGSLLEGHFKPETTSIGSFADEYARDWVFQEDKSDFLSFLSIDGLFEKYYRGARTTTLIFREICEGDFRWLKLTVDMVEYPHSTEVEAYLLFENIDEERRAELLTSERAETDPLTGVYNRTTFAEKVAELISDPGAQAKHALLMLDVDYFKFVNDSFGHAAGDRILLEMAEELKKTVRREDLVGRLGGDEFVVFLKNISSEKTALSRAKKICDNSRKSLGENVQISSSVGIAIYPDDGDDFETLYKKADEALYHVKDSGRDGYALYKDNMNEVALTQSVMRELPDSGKLGRLKRRMLIVDDNKLDTEMLANIFRGEYSIEIAKDGEAALTRLRHYGTGITVVLLDLIMPGMSGFAVLEKMQDNAEMRNIPVIVVSGADERDSYLKAIRAGAADYVTKPVDPQVLQIRVGSAVGKAENARLRAKNQALEMKHAEAERSDFVLAKTGIAVVELNWGTGCFIYGASVADRLFGKYDGRSLWHIFMSDMVTDADTVKSLQQLVHDVAGDRERCEAKTEARLKTPTGQKHLFSISVYKQKNEFGLADKMILTFKDLETAD